MDRDRTSADRVVPGPSPGLQLKTLKLKLRFLRDGYIISSYSVSQTIAFDSMLSVESAFYLHAVCPDIGSERLVSIFSQSHFSLFSVNHQSPFRSLRRQSTHSCFSTGTWSCHTMAGDAMMGSTAAAVPLVGKKLMSKLGGMANESAAAEVSDFARRQMEKMGWSAGKGLGKNEQGMKSHVKVKRREELQGVGAEKKAVAEQANQWWYNAYDRVASKIVIDASSDEEGGEEDKEEKKKKKKKKDKKKKEAKSGSDWTKMSPPIRSSESLQTKSSLRRLAVNCSAVGRTARARAS